MSGSTSRTCSANAISSSPSVSHATTSAPSTAEQVPSVHIHLRKQEDSPMRLDVTPIWITGSPSRAGMPRPSASSICSVAVRGMLASL